MALLALFLMLQTPFLAHGACPTTTDLSLATQTSSTASFLWSPVPGATIYTIAYRPLNPPQSPWTFVTSTSSSITLLNLLPNTMYEVQLRTECGAEFSNFSNIVQFSTYSCMPPIATVISTGITTANLRWFPVTTATSYRILYRPNSIPAPAWSVANTTDTTRNLTGLAPNTLYEYRMLSICSGTPSDTSAAQYFSTAPCVTPHALNTSTITPTSIRLHWNSIAGATRYEVEYQLLNDTVWSSVSTVDTFRNLTSLSINSQYRLRVRTRCGSGAYSDYSLPILASTGPCFPPSNLVFANVGFRTFSVSFNSGGGATDYRVEYRAVGSSSWTTRTVSAPTLIITGLDPDTEYEVRVRSRCGPGVHSSYTPIQNVRTSRCLAPDVSYIDSIGFRAASVSWNPVPLANRYLIEYKPVDSTLWTTVGVDTPITRRLISGLDIGTVYQARVRSRCATGIFSNYGDTLTFGVDDCITPTSLTVSAATFTSATLNWDTATYATNYRLRYRPVSDTAWNIVTSSATSRTLTGLNMGTEYVASVQSRCATGHFSAWSDTMRFKTVTCEAPEGFFLDSIEYREARAVWNPVALADRYQVQRRLYGDTTWTTATSDSAVYWLRTLDQGNLYEVRLRSRCAIGVFSAYTDAISFYTSSCPAPAIRQIDSLSATSYRIHWNSIPEAIGYRVRYQATTDTAWIYRNTTDTFRVITGLDPTKTYRAEVQSRCREDVRSTSGQGISSMVLVAARCGIRWNPIQDICTNGNPIVISVSGGIVDPFAFAAINLVSNQTSQVLSFVASPNINLIPDPGNRRSSLFNFQFPGTFNLAAGSYTICLLGRDPFGDPSNPSCQNNCTTFNVATPPVLQNQTYRVCANKPYDITANGLDNPQSGVTYTWAPIRKTGHRLKGTKGRDLTLGSSVTYTVTARAGNCTSTATVTVLIAPGDLDIGGTFRCPAPVCQNQNSVIIAYEQIQTAPELASDERLDIRIFEQVSGLARTLNLTLDRGFTDPDGGTRLTISNINNIQFPAGATSVQLIFNIQGNLIYGPDDDVCSLTNLQRTCTLTIYKSPDVSLNAVVTGNSANVVANVSGGVPPYTYAWSNGGNAGQVSINVTQPTNLCVTVTDSRGCSNVACDTISPAANPQDDCPVIVPSSQRNQCSMSIVRLCLTPPPTNPGAIYFWDLGSIIPDLQIQTNEPCVEFNANIPLRTPIDIRQISVVVTGPNQQQVICTAAIFYRDVVPFTGTPWVNQDLLASELITRLGLTGFTPVVNAAAIGGSSTFRFTRSFVVDRNITFRNLNVEIFSDPNIDIQVRPGATLFFDGCWVHGVQLTGRQLWQGIDLIGNSNARLAPRVVLDTTILENAVVGIRCSTNQNLPNRIAGLVKVDRSCLNQNETHIQMHNVLGNWLLNEGILSPLILRTSWMDCINPLPAGLHTTTGVDVVNVTNMEVGSQNSSGAIPRPSGWPNRHNDIQRLQVGVRAVNTGLRVNNITFHDFVKDELPAVPFAQDGICILYDITRLVVAGRASRFLNVGDQSPNNYYILNNYGRIRHGIEMRGLLNTTDFGNLTALISNNFFIDEFNMLGHLSSGVTFIDTAIYINKLTSSTVDVHNNISRNLHTFLRTSYPTTTPISLLGSTLSLSIQENASQYYDEGIIVNNGGFSEGIPEIIINNIFQGQVDFNGDQQGYGISSFRSSSSGGQSGPSLTRINDNIFLGFRGGILLSGNHAALSNTVPFEINGNSIKDWIAPTIPVTAPVDLSYNGIRVNSGGLGQIHNNVVNVNASASSTADGIEIEATPGTDVRCNVVKYARYATQFFGTSSPNTNLRFNSFDACSTGITLSNQGIIGPQGGTLGEVDFTVYNQWSSSCVAGTFTRLLTNGSLSPLSVSGFNKAMVGTHFVFDPARIGLGNLGEPGSTAITSTAFVDVPPVGIPCGGGDLWPSLARLNTNTNQTLSPEEQTLVRTLQSNSPYASEVAYTYAQHLFAYLAQKPDYRQNRPMLDSFFYHAAATNIGRFYMIDRLSTANRAQAVQMNNAIAPTNRHESTLKVINALSLSESLSSTQWQTIVEIAHQCPIVDGIGVYKARALRSVKAGKVFGYENDCQAINHQNGTPYRHSDMSKAEVIQLEIFPNPADASFTIRMTQPSAGELSLVDIAGQKVISRLLNGEQSIIHVDVKHLPAGIYLCKVTTANGTTSQKLIITH
jgi:hypothetical protein